MVQTDDESATNLTGDKIDVLKNVENNIAIIFNVQDKVRLLKIMFLSDLSNLFSKMLLLENQLVLTFLR